MSRSITRSLLVLSILAVTCPPVSATISTAAGTGVAGFNGDGVPASQAQIRYPWQVAIDINGDLLIADRGNNRIRRVDAVTGLISTVAGTGVDAFSGDGGLATSASLSAPWGLAAEATGDILIGDGGNARIRVIDSASSTITTMLYPLGSPLAMSFVNGDFYFLDSYFQQVTRLDLSSMQATVVAGTGNLFPQASPSGDDGPATAADLYGSSGFAFNSAGDLLIAEAGRNTVRAVDAVTGIITTIAGGNGAAAFGGDGGPAVEASYWTPAGLAVDADDNVFIADQVNRRIRRIDAVTGIVTTVAGNGDGGSGGNGGPARLAGLDGPGSLTFDKDGSLLVSTLSDVRRITTLDLNANAILAASPSVIVNPRRKMVKVVVSFAETSLCSDPSEVLLAVSSNEPDDAPGGADGHTRGDIQKTTIGTSDLEFSVRSERSRNGTGRVYQADYLVTCGSGEQTVSSVFVTVPR